MHWIDPDYLPETAGALQRFLVNANGEIDGFILADGTEVHVPPHMGEAVRRAVAPGAAVRVRGVRPRGAAMIAAVAIEPADGARIVDDGPEEHDEDARDERRHAARDARVAMEVAGVVRRRLHGPKGELRGVLLEDGRAGRFPPHAGAALADLLSPGAPIVMHGEGLATPVGTVVAVRAIGTKAGALRMVEPKRSRPKQPGGKTKGAPAPTCHAPQGAAPPTMSA
jgi:hypothetical protein